MLRGLSDAQLRWVYAHAHALVAPSLEDYGLTPLEAAAFGHPTVALRAGGYLDTVVDGHTGVFMDHPDIASLGAALDQATATTWDTGRIRHHAEAFDEAHFADRIRGLAIKAATGADSSPDPEVTG